MNGDLTVKEKALGCVLAAVLVSTLVLAFNVIPWAIWNQVVSPLTGWRQLTFWQVFFLMWLLGIIGSCFKSAAK